MPIIKRNGREIQVAKKITRREVKAWVQYWIDRRSVELGITQEKFLEMLRK
jgi:hypothetical protein